MPIPYLLVFSHLSLCRDEIHRSNKPITPISLEQIQLEQRKLKIKETDWSSFNKDDFDYFYSHTLFNKGGRSDVFYDGDIVETLVDLNKHIS